MDFSEDIRHIPEATVARLPIYLRSLLDFSENGVETVSSEKLAISTGVNAAKVRKDLSHLGSYGTRGVGYEVDYLVHQISHRLGLNRKWHTAIVGVGNLGTALANFKGFRERGFQVDALFDSDTNKIGEKMGGIEVQGMEEIIETVERRNIDIGIVTVPPGAAQEVADRLVAGGVTGLLNFSPVVLDTPEGVVMRKVDLSIELQILAFYVGRDGSFFAL